MNETGLWSPLHSAKCKWGCQELCYVETEWEGAASLCLALLQLGFIVSSPTARTITDFPALSGAEPLHPCATSWFARKTWSHPKAEAPHPFLLPHLLGLWSSPGYLLQHHGDSGMSPTGTSILDKSMQRQTGGKDNTSSHWEGYSFHCQGAHPVLWAHWNGQRLLRSEGSKPGVSSATVDWAICQWEPSNKHFETPPCWWHQNMWLFGAVGKQEPDRESNAAASLKESRTKELFIVAYQCAQGSAELWPAMCWVLRKSTSKTWSHAAKSFPVRGKSER